MSIQTTQCKRCGQQKLAWVQSKKTGRFYLAHTQTYHGMHHGNGYSRGGTNVLAHQPHKCDEDRPVCNVCGYRHDAHYSGSFMDCKWRQDGGRIVEDGYELLYRGESPKVAHADELPRKLIESHRKGN